MPSYFDRLPPELLRRIWHLCDFQRLRNAHWLLSSAPLYNLLRTDTRKLILSAHSNFRAEQNTVVLNEECHFEAADALIRAVGGCARDLSLYSMPFGGVDATRLAYTIAVHCTAARTLAFAWMWGESEEYQYLLCNTLVARGSQLELLDIEVMPDSAFVGDMTELPADVKDCLEIHCTALKEVRCYGDVTLAVLTDCPRVLERLEAFNIYVCDFLFNSWGPALDRLQLHCTRLRILRLDQCTFDANDAGKLTRLYVDCGERLVEASLANLGVVQCTEVVNHCPNLETCSIVEDGTGLDRFELLAHRVRLLYLRVSADINLNDLSAAMLEISNLRELVAWYGGYDPGFVGALLPRAFPELEVLQYNPMMDMSKEQLQCILSATRKWRELSLTAALLPGLAALREAEWCNTMLRKLSILVCHITGVASCYDIDYARGVANELIGALRDARHLEEIYWGHIGVKDSYASERRQLLARIFAPFLRRRVRVCFLGQHFPAWPN